LVAASPLLNVTFDTLDPFVDVVFNTDLFASAVPSEIFSVSLMQPKFSTDFGPSCHYLYPLGLSLRSLFWSGFISITQAR
jgi:hypothetical protein